jgi:hypothetical protein
MTEEIPAASELIRRLSAYVAASGEAKLPPAVVHKVKHHISTPWGRFSAART